MKLNQEYYDYFQNCSDDILKKIIQLNELRKTPLNHAINRGFCGTIKHKKSCLNFFRVLVSKCKINHDSIRIEYPVMFKDKQMVVDIFLSELNIPIEMGKTNKIIRLKKLFGKMVNVNYEHDIKIYGNVPNNLFKNCLNDNYKLVGAVKELPEHE